MNQCKACKNKAKDSGYCGKHLRLKIIDEAKVAGKTLCQPLRGCFTEIKGTMKRCLDCRNKENNKDRARKVKKLEDAVEIKCNERICTLCFQRFESWVTERGDAKRCTNCHAKHTVLDKRRGARIRNYKEEAARNLQTIFESTRKSCITGKRGRIIVWDLSFEEFDKLVHQPCTYCLQNNASEIRGIDRIDNDKGYISTNVVSACGICNRMKHILHPEFFIDHCNVIRSGFTIDHMTKWPEYYKHKTHGYTYYKRMAITRRELSWEISEDLYNSMIRSACYLCGYKESTIGIDRLDSEIGYIESNCSPCCSPCNMMKHTLSVEAFKEKIAQISLTDVSSFISIPRRAYLLGKSKI